MGKDLSEISVDYSMDQVKQLLVNNGYICMAEVEKRKVIFSGLCGNSRNKKIE